MCFFIIFCRAIFLVISITLTQRRKETAVIMRFDNDTMMTMTETNIMRLISIHYYNQQTMKLHVVHQWFSDGPQEIYERKPIMHNIDSRH